MRRLLTTLWHLILKQVGTVFQDLKLMTKENSLNSNLMKKPLCISALKNKQKYMVQI